MNNKQKEAILSELCSPRIDIFNKKYDFNGARRMLFNDERIKIIMKKNGVKELIEISSGVSDKEAFKPYIEQAVQDLKSNLYYRNYYPNKGESVSREALAYLENQKFGTQVYTKDDIVLTEGSTGGISAFIEYFSKSYKNKEVLITNPSYYLYKSACIYNKVPFREISMFNTKTDIDDLIKTITPETKLIILNNPFNPTGELYSRASLKKLVLFAKKQGIFLFVDELFQDLVFDSEQFTTSDIVAYQKEFLENLIIVKGYSKNKNLVGFRIGYLFSKNKSVIEEVAKINQIRHCFPTGSNCAGLIILDAFVQSVLACRCKSTLTGVKKVKKTFPPSSVIRCKSDRNLTLLVENYKNYFTQIMSDYSRSFDLCIKILEKYIVFKPNKISAFNTFVKIPTLNKINMFDFTLNLYVTTGVKIEIGPCFGYSQKEWETNPRLGFWLRITFAKDSKTLVAGLQQFMRFYKQYTKGDSEWIQTGLEF